MKLSTRGKYGLKAMFELSLQYGKGPMSLREIGLKHNISANYLEHIFSDLKKSGLVESIRGAQGGYILKQEPNKISVGDIIRSLEGDIAPVSCVSTSKERCPREDKCVTKNVWKKLNDSINSAIDTTTLADMAEDYNID